MNISFIGLGKLGLCSAVCFANKGHHVIGVDSSQKHIDLLKSAKCPIDEPGLEEMLDKSRQNMEFTLDYSHAINHSDITLIIVPTPSNPDGRFSNIFIEKVLDQIALALKNKKEFHVVDIVSTVMPLTCKQIFKKRLEKLTGKVCGHDFGLVYNPEFIALGSVIRDFLHPDMVLIGASDDRSAMMVKELYASMVESSPHYALMSLTNAEIAKLSLNCFVTMKISFANELALLCENISGADINVVTAAIGEDSRIGSKYLKGGLGFGGPCFPRDNLAFQGCAEDAGIHLLLSPQVVRINNEIVERLFKITKAHASPGSTVALLGLSYKPGTHIVEESQPIMLAKKLLDAGYSVRMHDPKALKCAFNQLNGRGVYCEKPYDAVSGASVILLLTNWSEYESLEITQMEERAGSAPLLVDCWRIFKNAIMKKFSYYAIGIGEDH